ncbi:MAG TPA: hypothetical protein VMR16_03200 [Candidatus Saccharimonadales bacterium]|nr:hypothetical protein [Candidatus Saccharimonadales bacterium]
MFIGKQDRLLVFDDSIPYALQNNRTINIDEYICLFNMSLHKLVADKKITDCFANHLKENFSDMIDNVIGPLINKEQILCDKYTLKYLRNFYSLLGFIELSDFIKESYLYYYSSNIMTKWIPYCINNTFGKKSLINLINNGVVSRRPFRATMESVDDIQINNIKYINNNINTIANLISQSKIIPSIDVFYWSMELAGKKHFGNDYGFFERYSNFLNQKLDNQITDAMTEFDGFSLFQIEDDYSLVAKGEELSYKNSCSKSKPTRINSMNSIYILIGSDLKHTNPLNPEVKTISLNSI